MKKMLFLALVAMTVATMTACNKEHQSGLEYQTPTDIEGIVFWSKGKNPSSPIAADQPVVVNATLSNPYRLYLALIRYTVDQSAVTTPSEDYEPGVERTASEVEYEPDRLQTRAIYQGEIPKQPVGSKVSFYIWTISPFGVVSYSFPQEYTVTVESNGTGGLEPEPEPEPEPEQPGE